MEECEIKFSRIFEYGKYSDTLKLSDGKLHTQDGCTFDVHRLKLSTNCEYFRAMFCRIHTNSRDFLITGISGECLSDILLYIYTKEITVNEKNVTDLLTGTNYLLLDDLSLMVRQSVKADLITDNNCLKILQAANQICDERIFGECFRYVQTRFEKVMLHHLSTDVADLPLEVLELILRDRSLCVHSEESVWLAIAGWTIGDTSSRMCHVPRLLCSLAFKEVDEALAMNILKHTIVLDNPFMEDIISKIKASYYFSYLDALNYFHDSTAFNLETLSYRIPKKLHVISSLDDYYNNIGSKLYITYDENVDLWCKIAEMDFIPEFLTAVGHNIYVFRIRDRICRKFDLSSMRWAPMEIFSCHLFNSCSAAVGTSIYVFGELGNNDHSSYPTNHVEVYNTSKDRWNDGVPPPRPMYEADALAIERKIYVVGYSPDFYTASIQVFDTVTQQWFGIAPPFTDFMIVPVAYKKKIYLTRSGETTAHMDTFDPATNVWKELPELPRTSCWILARGLDSLIVCDNCHRDGNDMEKYRWNEAEECWEKMEETSYRQLRRYNFCSIEDEGTIRMITQRNRNPVVELEKTSLGVV